MIVMPLGQAEDDHGDHRNKDEYLETVAALPTIWMPRMFTQAMTATSAKETIQCFQPAIRKIIGQIIGEEYGIRTAEKERGGPVPPSREKSPEISECGAAPAIEAAFDRHGSGEFGGHERDRDRQEKWDDQKKIRLMPGPLVVTMPSSPKGPPVV